MNMIKTTLAAAALMALPFAASAATTFAIPTDIVANDAYSESATVEAGGTGGTFTFNVLERLRINGISLSATGSSGGADLANTTYVITKPSDSGGLTVITFGNAASGFAGFDGITDYAAGESFDVVFTTGPAAFNPVSYTVSFETSEVPVPAAGLLLLTALGGAAAMRRRKKA
jgi:hypothetical protein